MKDERLTALRRLKNVEKRTLRATDLAHDLAEEAAAQRAERNRYALYAVYGPREQRQKDVLEVLGITRRAWKVLDRRWAREHTACPVCGAQPGEKCPGLPGPAESIHEERYLAHVEQIRREAQPVMDPVAQASEYAARVDHLDEVEREALEIRFAGLRALYEMSDKDGQPLYQPSDLARIANVTTSRIGHMGFRATWPRVAA